MTNALRILIIEDERDLVASVAEYFQANGHVTDVALDGQSGLQLALSNSYDAVVLDLGLPRLDGLSVCKAIRSSAQNSLPLLMLTARDTLEDKLKGFDYGADDYLVKPFALAELERRIVALARRSVLNRGQVLEVGDLHFDVQNDLVTRLGEPLILNPACRRLLACLMRHSPHIVSRDDLEYSLWGDSPPQGEGLKTHIHMLRQAVVTVDDAGRDSNSMIETVRGRGYRIVP